MIMDETTFVIFILGVLFFPTIFVLATLWWWLHRVRVQMSVHMNDIYRTVLDLSKRIERIEKGVRGK